MDKNKEQTMDIRYALPGKSRPRVMQAHYKSAPIEAFRELFSKYPEAIPISFDGHMIRKSV